MTYLLVRLVKRLLLMRQSLAQLVLKVQPARQDLLAQLALLVLLELLQPLLLVLRLRVLLVRLQALQTLALRLRLYLHSPFLKVQLVPPEQLALQVHKALLAPRVRQEQLAQPEQQVRLQRLLSVRQPQEPQELLQA